MTKITYTYIPTDNFVKAFVKCIWWLTDDDMNFRKEKILPKGTVEIIFNLSDDIIYNNSTTSFSKTLPSVFVNGLNYKPFELHKTGAQNFIGIQLNAIGLRLLFNISAKEMNDAICEGCDLSLKLVFLAEKLNSMQTFQQRVDVIMKWLKQQISFISCQYVIFRAQKLLSLVNQNNLSVKKLSTEICLSERQLRRFSTDWLGMNTEELFHYEKYLTCLHSLHYSKQTLTDIGFRAGYYDQSHFIREFKSYTNMTPKQYREANTEYPGHILMRI